MPAADRKDQRCGSILPFAAAMFPRTCPMPASKMSDFGFAPWLSARLILIATAVCGAVDIGYAIVMSVTRGGTALAVLHSVASGPFGDDIDRLGWVGGLLGLAVHFSIMSVMVGVFCVAVARLPRLNSIPLLSGIAYGVICYIVMYWVVLALRWPDHFPQTDPTKVFRALLPHLVCVGIPLAFLVRKASRVEPEELMVAVPAP
jgi:hypothetical protein